MASLRSSDIPRKDTKPGDIGDFKPERLELDWNIENGLPDNHFYMHHYASITSYVKNMVEHVFMTGNYPPQGSVWSSTGEESISLQSIISDIARPDPCDLNPWDDLMVCKAKRFCVMRGVLMKVFTDRVFSQLLFGANEKQKAMLRQQDEDFIKDDGFRRTEMRSYTVRTMLGHTRGIPPCFWDEVDKLAMAVLILVLPVLNWTRRTLLPTGNVLDITNVYQHIHHCVSYAAWFAVQIRRSNSILKFTWVSPGDRYLPDQIELCSKLRSKYRPKLVESDFAKVHGRNVASSATQNPPPKSIARVMIAVVPRFEMFMITTMPDSGATVGHTVNTLADVRVVYYHGLENDADDSGLFRTSLLEHSLSARQRRLVDFDSFLGGIYRYTFRILVLMLELVCWFVVVMAFKQHWQDLTSKIAAKEVFPEERKVVAETDASSPGES